MFNYIFDFTPMQKSYPIIYTHDMHLYKKIYLLLIVTENANVEKLFAKTFILNLTTR